jgi:hypothetical protein
MFITSQGCRRLSYPVIMAQLFDTIAIDRMGNLLRFLNGKMIQRIPISF